jgi:hypothetical protein
VERPQKITLGEMRASGVRGVLIYCSDFQCSHWIRMIADQSCGQATPPVQTGDIPSRETSHLC